MPISFRCPSCGVQHTVLGKMAGRQVHCKCGVLMAIPADPRLAADAMPEKLSELSSQPAASSLDETRILIGCPSCGVRRIVPLAYRGKTVRCPCGKTFQVGRRQAMAAQQDGVTSATEPVSQTPAAASPAPQAPSTRQAAPGSDGASSLFDGLTDDDLGENVRLQPLEPTVSDEGSERVETAALEPQGRKAHARGRLSSKVRGSADREDGNGIGYVVFAVLCGVPGLEMSGFGLGLSIGFPIALACSVVGGMIGGALICPRPIAAGIIGGVVAGPLGLLAVYYYTLPREVVYTVELTVVQMLASLPGLGVGYVIKKLLSIGGRE